jgi:hypothetical protein
VQVRRAGGVCADGSTAEDHPNGKHRVEGETGADGAVFPLVAAAAVIRCQHAGAATALTTMAFNQLLGPSWRVQCRTKMKIQIFLLFCTAFVTRSCFSQTCGCCVAKAINHKPLVADHGAVFAVIVRELRDLTMLKTTWFARLCSTF